MQTSLSDSSSEEGRKKAIRLYRALAVIQLLLGAFLLACGSLGTQYGDENFGPPFYLGGFIVGALMLLSALLCMCIGSKGSDFNNEIRRNEAAACVSCHNVTAMLTFMGCFMGLIFAGISSCGSFYDECSPERDNIKYAIIGGIVAAILTNIYSIYILCTYGRYFGVLITAGRRHAMVVTVQNTPYASTPIHGTHIVAGLPTGLGSSAGNDARLQQLERENQLLQRRLELQQQFNQQSPPHPHTRAGYPPPQPTTYGFRTDPALSSFPPVTEPNVAPPSYNSLNIPK